MFRIYRFTIFFLLNLFYLFYRIMKKGPFGKNRAFFTDKIKAEKSPLKACLVGNQVKQFNEASCSVASVTIILNALREIENKKVFKPLLQKEILEKVKTGNWKERMSPKGDRGRRGLPLGLLGEVVRESLEVYSIDYEEIRVVSFDNFRKNEDQLKKDLKSALDEFEKGKALLIAHFNQGLYLKTLQIPHISPVGAYDCKTKMVTIMDVDFSVEKNYQIDFETFYKGLASNYYNLFASHGYRSGGYVFIKLRPGNLIN